MLDTLNKAEERKEKMEDLDQRAAVLLNKVSTLSFTLHVYMCTKTGDSFHKH